MRQWFPEEILPADERKQHGTLSTLKNRTWVETEYLPSLRGDILFVGVGPYTNWYHELVQTPERFKTVDIRDSVAMHGSPFGHWTCDFCKFGIMFDASSKFLFDHVCIYGILNYKPAHENRLELVRDFIKHADELVKPGGTFMFGPNRSDERTTAEMWAEEMKRPPLDGYEEMYFNFDGFLENCVWRGRKSL